LSVFDLKFHHTYTNLICVPAPHVVRRDSLEDFLENLCVAFCRGRPQVLKLIGERVCHLAIFLGLEGNLMRMRYGSHVAGNLVTVGETELRFDEPEMFWFLSVRSSRRHKEVLTLEQGTTQSSCETRHLIWFTVHS